MRRLVDAADELLDAQSALLGIKLAWRSEPGVGRPVANHERALRPAQAPADHLVDRELGGPWGLTATQVCTPKTPWGPASVPPDLNHRLAHHSGIDRNASVFAVTEAPMKASKPMRLERLMNLATGPVMFY